MASIDASKITDVYIDESLHPDLGIAVIAIVFGEGSAVDGAVGDALLAAGLRPDLDEFKASAPYRESERLRDGRDQLLGFAAREVAIGVAVVPIGDRSRLGEHALRALQRLASTNRVELGRVRVHMDQGLFAKPGAAITVRRDLRIELALLDAAADSKTTRGLQVADLVANVIARIIRERATGIEKLIVEGEEGVEDMPLNWHLKMQMRWALFSGPHSIPEVAEDVRLVSVYPFAVYTDGLSLALQQAVESSLATAWLGCLS